MSYDGLSAWAHTNPWPAALVLVMALALLAAAIWCAARLVRSAVRPQASVVVAALAAAGCTAYGADTSWRFAAHTLGMTDTTERAALFFVAELALFACALMARANLSSSGTLDTPGVLVWVTVGVQIIPAYAESGLVGGTVRGFIGSVLAGVMWHQAMGIELRHARPGKVPSSPGLVGRPRRRPDVLLGDRGYDHDKYRRLVWAQGIKPVIARRTVPHGSGLGIHRWVVERTIACCTASADCASAGNDATTSTKPSSASPPA